MLCAKCQLLLGVDWSTKVLRLWHTAFSRIRYLLFYYMFIGWGIGKTYLQFQLDLANSRRLTSMYHYFQWTFIFFNKFHTTTPALLNIIFETFRFRVWGGGRLSSCVPVFGVEKYSPLRSRYAILKPEIRMFNEKFSSEFGQSHIRAERSCAESSRQKPCFIHDCLRQHTDRTYRRGTIYCRYFFGAFRLKQRMAVPKGKLASSGHFC